MNINLAEAPTREEPDTHMRALAYHSPSSQQIAYSASSQELSTDVVGTPEPAVFDSVATIVQGKRCVLYVWHDNEYVYSSDVVRPDAAFG